MKLEMTDKQLQKLLECAAQCHAVEWMKGNDDLELEKVIQAFAKSLQKAGKNEIFYKVFTPGFR